MAKSAAINSKRSATRLLALRRLAEAACQDITAAAVPGLDGPASQSTQAIIHELRVHQIELEMQNEELCQVVVALETSRERYVNLYDLAPTGYCTLSDKGLIQEINLTAAQLLGVSRPSLIRRALSRFVQPDDQASYYQWQMQALQGGPANACELRMRHHTGTQFWALLNATTSVNSDKGMTLRVVLSDITARKDAEAAFDEAQMRLRHFTLRQQDEFDSLRMELAHDVHDQLGQTLAGLKLEIDGIREADPTTAARMQDMIMQGMNAIRDISRTLRPIALELGLIHALQSLVTQLSVRSDISFRSSLPKELPMLAMQVERGLYRIAQEALTNAVLHAHATEVLISVNVIGGRLKLEVRDDGQGFVADAPSVRLGLGLTGIRERARQLGANLSIKSGPVEGTRIVVSMQCVPAIKS